MGKYQDYINSVGVGEDGAYMYPDTFIADLNGAYEDDFAGATATIAQKDAEIQNLTAQNQQLAAANWTLLQQIPANGGADVDANTDTGDGDGDGDGDGEDDDPDVDDFFKPADK